MDRPIDEGLKALSEHLETISEACLNDMNTMLAIIRTSDDDDEIEMARATVQEILDPRPQPLTVMEVDDD